MPERKGEKGTMRRKILGTILLFCVSTQAGALAPPTAEFWAKRGPARATNGAPA